MIGERGIDDLRQRAGAGDAEQRPRRNQIGEIERRDRELLGLLHHRRGADRKIRLELADGGQIHLERRAVLDARALGLQPFPIGVGPLRSRAGRADIGHARAALDQQPRDQQFGTFIAGDRDAGIDRLCRQRRLDHRQEAVLGGVDLVAGDVAGRPDRFEPGLGAVMADRRGADDLPAGEIELAEARGVERMDRGDDRTIQRRIELAPFARRHHRTGREPQRLQHHADADGIGRKHLADQRDRRPFAPAAARRLHRPLLDFLAGIFEHRRREHVLGFGMGRHAEARHVDADDAHAVDLIRQQIERHARGRRHAEIGDDDGVVKRGIGELEDGFADVLEQFAGDQRLRIERHVTDRAPRAIEMRGERQAIDAAGRAGEDRRGAAHAQADPQRAERRAHALRLVVRTFGIVCGVAIENVALARGARPPPSIRAAPA